MSCIVLYTVTVIQRPCLVKCLLNNCGRELGQDRGSRIMLFFSFFQSLVDKNVQVTVELKNDLQISGILHSVDQYLNIKLNNVSINDPERYPHLLAVKNCFIRGSVVRYVHLNPADVDTELLQDFCRKEAQQQQQSGTQGKPKKRS